MSGGNPKQRALTHGAHIHYHKKRDETKMLLLKKSLDEVWQGDLLESEQQPCSTVSCPSHTVTWISILSLWKQFLLK